ncbi:MAG TPA: serine hydrolase domain-containing protein [Solirubrobacteraceae bacterium]|nr:serine hydrolase domain-containing protein [Solirubrobacteraceae bacterium]
MLAGLRLPRPPIGPDPLRRIEVPRDLATVTVVGEEDDPRAGGMDDAGVQRIWRGVQGLYRSGVHPAIQLCLRREGRVVLDRAIGHARPDVPVTTGTPFLIYSAAKSVTAMVAHLLDQRGDIHFGDRVVEYIPEYASHGKHRITIGHILSHRAGVPNLPPEALDLDLIEDSDTILRLLCDARPSTRPGKLLAYHAISGGYVIAELVRRVTGRSIREVLAREILDPLGFRWTNYGVPPEDLTAVGRAEVTGAPVLPPLSTLLTRALGKPVDQITRESNDPRFLTGIIPSANIVSTANEMSRFYELLRNGGELDGVRIFEPRTIRRATTEQSSLEIDLGLAFPARYSLGFMLGARVLSLWGPDTEQAFGHLGFTNVMTWADPQRALAGALITSGKPIVYPELPELWTLMRRIGMEAPKVDRRAALA